MLGCNRLDVPAVLRRTVPSPEELPRPLDVTNEIEGVEVRYSSFQPDAKLARLSTSRLVLEAPTDDLGAQALDPLGIQDSPEWVNIDPLSDADVHQISICVLY
jgi:hypothetical protein